VDVLGHPLEHVLAVVLAQEAAGGETAAGVVDCWDASVLLLLDEGELVEMLLAESFAVAVIDLIAVVLELVVAELLGIGVVDAEVVGHQGVQFLLLVELAQLLDVAVLLLHDFVDAFVDGFDLFLAQNLDSLFICHLILLIILLFLVNSVLGLLVYLVLLAQITIGQSAVDVSLWLLLFDCSERHRVFGVVVLPARGIFGGLRLVDFRN
jgi:hypothetical protein